MTLQTNGTERARINSVGNVGINATDLLKIIQTIPEGYRVVFNLFAIEGYTHKEIADELGVTESTSKSQYSRAKKMLRKLLVQNNIVEESER